MQYLLMLYADESNWANMTTEQQQQGYAAYVAYREALSGAGALVGSNRLRPAGTATTLHSANGKLQVLDGPFIDSKESLGGYFLIEAPDLDAAIAWAAKCPGVHHGSIEVRAIWPTNAATQTYVSQEAVASR
jgi:hypothetical protein